MLALPRSTSALGGAHDARRTGFSPQVTPITYLKFNAAEVLEQLLEQRLLLVFIQNGETWAVLPDVVSFEETQATLFMFKLLVLGSQDVAAGKVQPVADVVASPQTKRAAV